MHLARFGFSLICCLAAPLAAAQSFFASGFEDGEGPVLKPGLGTNLESVLDFAAAYPFADFFKQSRPWITSSQAVFDTDDADQLDLDANGWVQSLPACTADPQQFCIARTVLFSNPDTIYPSGTYTVRFDGEGTVVYRQNSALLVPVSSPGQDLLQLTGDQIFQIDVTATAPPPNHLRNIRVYPPGINPDNPPLFHPDFLARLEPYRSIRFMDWMRANGDGFFGSANPQEVFSDRPLPTDAHWSRLDGVPLEVMVELANLTGAEPWFTLPHGVNDDYVTQFATLVRNQLDPELDIYVEHSNEVWNNFTQKDPIEARANELFGTVASQFERRLNAHGLRTRQFCDLFRAVFAEDAERIICTLGAQAANPFTAAEAADCPLAQDALLVDGPCLAAGDALAIAPYFGNYTNREENEDEIAEWTLDQLFAEISSGGQLEQNQATPCTDNGNTFIDRVVEGRCTVSSLEETDFFISASGDVAEARGMHMIAYEGGQHLALVSAFSGDPQAQARKDAVTALFVAANRDPRMRDVYVDYFERWKALGGELFAHFSLTFSYGPFGSWGVLESLTQQPDPPKLQGILDFNTANPCWWTGCRPGFVAPPPPPPACTQPLLDPGLEGSAWSSTSQRFGTALCTTGTCSDATDPTTVGPRAGSGWAWFGGTLTGQHAEVSTISQSVVIPSADPRHLNFFLRRGFTSMPLDAVLEVRVDGQLQRTFDEPASAESSYVARTIDLSAFANNASHNIEFRYTNLAGSGKSNFNLDDVTLDCTASGN